jgi:hypothetical protein
MSVMKTTGSAAHHLASQGATFEGRSFLLGRTRRLKADKAEKHAESGRLVSVRTKNERFLVSSSQQMIEVDFFLAGGSSEGLSDPKLAGVLRELDFVPRRATSPASYPMETYRLVMREGVSPQVDHELLGIPKRLNRDGLVALGYFAGHSPTSEGLQHPQRAQSLKLLMEAEVLGSASGMMHSYLQPESPVDLKKGLMDAELLEQPEVVAERLETLDGLKQLQRKHFPRAGEGLDGLQRHAWKGELDLQATEQLFGQFSASTDGEKRLSRLLGMMEGTQLPTAVQVQQFQKAPADVQKAELNWLVSDPERSEERLALLDQVKPWMKNRYEWRNASVETMKRLEEKPELLGLAQRMNQVSAPLRWEDFEAAATLQQGEAERFEQVFGQVKADGVEGFGELWKDAGPDWEANRQKLLERGLDARRAAMAAAALGEEPTEHLLALAQKLDNDSHSYAANDYVLALKCAAELPEEQQQAFGRIFAGESMKTWSFLWPLTMDEPGAVQSCYVETLDELKARGIPLERMRELRASGVDGKTLLANVRETPDETALRAQRWVAYSTRKLAGSTSPRERAEWDRRMGQLQAGEIPWGEPPADRPGYYHSGVYPSGMP